MIPGIIASTPLNNALPDGHFILSDAENGIPANVMQQDGIPWSGTGVEWGYNLKSGGFPGVITPTYAYIDGANIVGYIVARDSIDGSVFFGLYLDGAELPQDFFTSISDPDIGTLLTTDADYFGNNPYNDGAVPISTHWIFYIGIGEFEDFFPQWNSGSPLYVALNK